MGWPGVTNKSLWILLLVGWTAGQREGRAQVRVKGGVLLGQEEQVGGRSVLAFRGIQYAEPPIGSARFLPSRPLTRGWSGVKSAREEGLPCSATVQVIEMCAFNMLNESCIAAGFLKND